MAHKTLTLQGSQIRDPIDAFQVRREIKEIKDALSDLPVIVSNEDPEGVIPAKIGSVLLQKDTGKLWRKETGDGTNDGWIDTSVVGSHTHTIADLPVLDEDDMTSNSANDVPTQQSVKAYVDNQAPKLSIGQTYNLEMGVSGSTLTISGFGGVALSATNIGYAAIRDTSGKRFLATFTANVTVTFGATSDTDGNTFGITAAANWANVMPHFLGIIYKSSTEYQFCFGRVPLNVSGAASTDLCQKGDTSGTSQGDVMILTTGLTLSQWVSLPITQVGWWKATWTTTNDNWDSFTLDNTTGFNFDYENVQFTFVSGQMGAASGKYLWDNGGTAPVFTTNTVPYWVTRSGYCHYRFYFNADGGTDGSGAVGVLIACPYNPLQTGSADACHHTGYVSNPTYTQIVAFNVANNGSSWIGGTRNSATTTTTNVQNGDFTAGARTIVSVITYKIC